MQLHAVLSKLVCPGEVFTTSHQSSQQKCLASRCFIVLEFCLGSYNSAYTPEPDTVAMSSLAFLRSWQDLKAAIVGGLKFTVPLCQTEWFSTSNCCHLVTRSTVLSHRGHGRGMVQQVSQVTSKASASLSGDLARPRIFL